MSKKIEEFHSPVEQLHDEEVIKMAKDLHFFAVKSLKELRQTYPKDDIPQELQAHERFFKGIIADTAVFLSETFNWPL